jgi:cardiolipin synthase
VIQQIAHLAEQRLWIASPYFVPDEGVVAALKLAALGGVDVRLLIADDSDNLLTTLAAYTFVDSLIDAGVRIFRYQPGIMHSKHFLFDEHTAAVSSINLDNRSLRLNFEMTALVIDTDFNRQVADMFADDFANSEELESKVFASKPFWFRVAARAAYLFAPVL